MLYIGVRTEPRFGGFFECQLEQLLDIFTVIRHCKRHIFVYRVNGLPLRIGSAVLLYVEVYAVFQIVGAAAGLLLMKDGRRSYVHLTLLNRTFTVIENYSAGAVLDNVKFERRVSVPRNYISGLQGHCSEPKNIDIYAVKGHVKIIFGEPLRSGDKYGIHSLTPPYAAQLMRRLIILNYNLFYNFVNRFLD